MKLIPNLQPIKLALMILSIAIAPLAAQGPVNHEVTKIQLNEPILIPGKVLPAGEYEIRVMNQLADREIVQFRNLKSNQVEALVIALTDYRTRRTGTTKFEYWETPKDTPPALRAWFYPDERWGVEFVYPTAMAKRIEQTRQTGKVPQADFGSNAPLTQETAKQVDLSGVPRKQPPAQTKSESTTIASNATHPTASSNTTLAKATTTDGKAASQSLQNGTQPQAKAPQSAKSPSKTGSSQTTATAQTQPQSSSQPQSQSKDSSTTKAKASQQSSQASNTLLAQNTAKSKTSPAASSNQQKGSQSAKSNSSAKTKSKGSKNNQSNNGQMPQTASPAPAIFLTGLGLMTGAFLLRRRRMV